MDDIHSRRFIKALKLEEQKQSDKFLKGERQDNYKFIFERPVTTQKLDLSDLNIVEIENLQTFHKTPKLAHNLNMILKQPGNVFPVEEMMKLQKDKESADFLKNIVQPDQVDFNAMPPYIPPSQDELLLNFAKESNINFIMSTSTISLVLAQLYYLFSNFRNPSFDKISSAYDNEPKKYMISQRKPITNMLRRIDKDKNIYALDSDSGLFKYSNMILMDLGKVMENQYCLDPETFKKTLMKGHIDPDAVLDTDHHRFMRLNNNICLRAQIDCQDVDENGNPFVFEIKTRALCPMRYDLNNYLDYMDYVVNQRSGIHSSFEREYYDMIRGAFLKYTFQLKIGRMDGAFVAYHNTKEAVGFEYVKTKEIERRIFGNSTYADTAFIICSKLLTTVLNLILDDLKGEDFEQLKIGYYSCSHYKRMVIFVELFNEKTEWGSSGLIQQTNEIKDEYDYYTKYKKFENTVYKYEFHVYPYINGVLQRSNNFNLNEYDQIDVEYKFKKLGKAGFLDYMNFLHEAYKFETINLDLNYVGAWVKNF
ncbi:hypothetical protein PPERSA_10621 [Pseudocohnilembus persalinus]|uniref:Uncharacterized protein n=1 Tax=Pseudocohnilembus persalinus TaxID=266149 RepID=A0A0V0QD29_PSEPJ|nr:hypothetical protein PPERSA_10621 [Pseudocohnilembus persalinus]|eukprot:KRX00122.1 hypothetical protein PPERSA_10621 [Pseudocohnilembus persalinus]